MHGKAEAAATILCQVNDRRGQFRQPLGGGHGFQLHDTVAGKLRFSPQNPAIAAFNLHLHPSRRAVERPHLPQGHMRGSGHRGRSLPAHARGLAGAHEGHGRVDALQLGHATASIAAKDSNGMLGSLRPRDLCHHGKDTIGKGGGTLASRHRFGPFSFDERVARLHDGFMTLQDDAFCLSYCSMLTSINPATDEEIGRYAPLTEDALGARIEGAEAAFRHWRNEALETRAARLARLAEVLRQEKDTHARLITAEMGKTLKEAGDEVEKCATTCDFYARHGEAFLADDPIPTESHKSYASFRPLGIVLAVMPWNFPFWQVVRAAAPALLAGNAMVLKHASNVSGCALALEQLFLKAGFPEHLFTTTLVESWQVAGMIAHPAIRAVTLTGSTQAGRKVAAAAGEHLKKSVMELGGSDAYVVLRDADLAKTVETCVTARLINAGQSCIAAKRFIVEAPLYDDFVEAMTDAFRQIVMGHPLEPQTRIGPMARRDLRDELHDQVTRSVKAGARCTIGGTLPSGKGAFYPTTVLADVTPGMAAFDEETFGPVAAIIRARDEADAIALANRSPFGLGSAVFTEDRERGERIARDLLEAGSAFVNLSVRSDPRLPFGGVKDSGYGRELSSFGIREFVNIKAVRVA